MSTHDTAGTAREGMTMDTERGEHREIARLIGDVRRAERERDEATARAERAEARVAELEAIIAGRTTPPTDAEIEAHAAATGGFWMVFCEDDFDLDMINDPWDRDSWLKAGAIGWVPYRDGRPCAWPTAEVSRG